MKNTMLMDEFCKYFSISDNAVDATPRMTKEQLSILVFDLLHRIGELEDRLDIDCGTYGDY